MPIVIYPSALRNLAMGFILIAAAMTALHWTGVELPEWVVDRVVKHIGLIVFFLLGIAAVKALEWLIRLLRGLFVWKSNCDGDRDRVVQSLASPNWYDDPGQGG